jgi:hypothetical protein
MSITTIAHQAQGMRAGQRSNKSQCGHWSQPYSS